MSLRRQPSAHIRASRHLRLRDVGRSDGDPQDFDVIGIVLLAEITAIGGGILPDVLIPRSAAD